MKIGVYKLPEEDYLHPDVEVIVIDCYEDLFSSSCDELYVNASALDEAEYLFLHDYKTLYTNPKIDFV
jgi:hypothetical protein